MTFEDADWLVGQWAAWSLSGDSSLQKLSASKAKWQMEYRAPFDPENDEPPMAALGVDEEMCSVVDRIMAAMLNQQDNRAYRVWWGRHVHCQVYVQAEVDSAYVAFEKYFDKVLSKSEQFRLNTHRGRRHA